MGLWDFFTMCRGWGEKKPTNRAAKQGTPFWDFLEFLEVIVEWSPQKRRKCAGDTECDHVGIG